MAKRIGWISMLGVVGVLGVLVPTGVAAQDATVRVSVQVARPLDAPRLVAEAYAAAPAPSTRSAGADASRLLGALPPGWRGEVRAGERSVTWVLTPL